MWNKLLLEWRLFTTYFTLNRTLCLLFIYLVFSDDFLSIFFFSFLLLFPHLHHQYDGVEGDHGQDSVLERRRHHKMPQTVLERVTVLRHVTSEGLSTDGKVNARPLEEEQQNY